MTILPTGPQFGVKYTLTGPDGTVVTFNDFSDPNNVGTLTDISGFDSPEVRESADDLVEMDGGIHGSFFYGRRPITLSGLIHEHADAADRNMRMARLMQATNAMRDDVVENPRGRITSGQPRFERGGCSATVWRKMRC